MKQLKGNRIARINKKNKIEDREREGERGKK
jgi:hypothetical protein